ncbi:hypothetical protein QBC39DRAFT_354300 [Podospora conica]|nr:hypothetical protein QBC39DRAFT_354300 [Schizothecium conicum]
MPFFSGEVGDEGYGLDLIQSDLNQDYVEPDPSVEQPAAFSPGGGPTVVGFDNDAGDMDVNYAAPFPDMDVGDDEQETESPPATAQKKRGRPSLGSRSAASDTPARTTVAKTPKTGKSTVKTPKSGKSTVASKASDRKRKAVEVEEEEEEEDVEAEAPPAKKRGRPARTTGIEASARLAAIAAKKPTRGRPKAAATTATKGKRGPAKKAAAADNGVPADEWEVEAIVESAIDADSMEHMYLVKWKGFEASENTWEPRKNLDHAAAMIKAFDAKKPKTKEPTSTKATAKKPVGKRAAATKAALAPKEKKKSGRKPGRPPGRPRKATKA